MIIKKEHPYLHNLNYSTLKIEVGASSSPSAFLYQLLFQNPKYQPQLSRVLFNKILARRGRRL